MSCRYNLPMRILGLDLGSKTIGVAVSDPMGWTAQGVETILRTSLDQDMDQLSRIIKEYEVTEILIGLPLHMSGEEGKGAGQARLFAEKLREKFSIPVSLVDERLSTVAAERGLLEADLSREKRRKVINKMAAVFILQGYLDSRRVPEGAGD